MNTNLKLTDSQMIDLLGGTVAVANKLRLSPAAVTQWKLNGIPLTRLVFLAAEIEKQSHGLVTRQDMFPKLATFVWPEIVPKSNTFIERI
jgi:DNA-binding transcriptional regulator YdaS (Cro superfamily)